MMAEAEKPELGEILKHRGFPVHPGTDEFVAKYEQARCGRAGLMFSGSLYRGFQGGSGTF
jgi:hypothetical protein